MRLDTRAMTTASGIVMAVLYSLCALAIAVSPVSFMASVGYMTHIDLTGVSRAITWASYISGLICWTLLAMVVAASITELYNRLAPRRDVLITRQHPELSSTEPRSRV